MSKTEKDLRDKLISGALVDKILSIVADSQDGYIHIPGKEQVVKSSTNLIATALAAARAEGRKAALKEAANAMHPMLIGLISRGEAYRQILAIIDKVPG